MNLMPVGGEVVDVDTLDYSKSSASGGNSDNCVEVAFANGGAVIRDTKDRNAVPQVYSGDEWRAFIAGAKLGEFDL